MWKDRFHKIMRTFPQFQHMDMTARHQLIEDCTFPTFSLIMVRNEVLPPKEQLEFSLGYKDFKRLYNVRRVIISLSLGFANFLASLLICSTTHKINSTWNALKVAQ